jgi:hypothetical protein
MSRIGTATSFHRGLIRTGPYKSVGASVQSTTGSRGVRISCSNAGYTMFRGGVKSTGYPLHTPVSPSLPTPPCVTVCHHISNGLYKHVCCCFRSLFCPVCSQELDVPFNPTVQIQQYPHSLKPRMRLSLFCLDLLF